MIKTPDSMMQMSGVFIGNQKIRRILSISIRSSKALRKEQERFFSVHVRQPCQLAFCRKTISSSSLASGSLSEKSVFAVKGREITSAVSTGFSKGKCRSSIAFCGKQSVSQMDSIKIKNCMVFSKTSGF